MRAVLLVSVEMHAITSVFEFLSCGRSVSVKMYGPVSACTNGTALVIMAERVL